MAEAVAVAPVRTAVGSRGRVWAAIGVACCAGGAASAFLPLVTAVDGVVTASTVDVAPLIGWSLVAVFALVAGMLVSGAVRGRPRPSSWAAVPATVAIVIAVGLLVTGPQGLQRFAGTLPLLRYPRFLTLSVAVPVLLVASTGLLVVACGAVVPGLRRRLGTTRRRVAAARRDRRERSAGPAAHHRASPRRNARQVVGAVVSHASGRRRHRALGVPAASPATGSPRRTATDPPHDSPPPSPREWTMTTGTPDPGPAGAPDPNAGIRIGLARRWWLRFQGRVEAAVAHPDPGPTDELISSRGAITLEARLHRTRSSLWERFVDDDARRGIEIDELLVQEQQERSRFQTAEDLLDRTRRAAPTPDTVAPTAGERAHGRSADLVLRRRTREHAAELTARQGDRDRSRAALDAIERRRTALTGARDRQYHRTVAREHLLIAVFLEERSIHDRALVLRHPLGSELARRLDARTPELSSLAAEALDGRGGTHG